jgi:hypothetical protein
MESYGRDRAGLQSIFKNFVTGLTGRTGFFENAGVGSLASPNNLQVVLFRKICLNSNLLTGRPL